MGVEHKALAAGALALALCGPALAIPSGVATSEVEIWNAPAVSGSRTGRSFVLVPVTSGFVGPGGNEAWARVAYAPAGVGGAFPVPGTPGLVSLELGAQVRMQLGGPLTTTGLPGDPALQPMWRHSVAASATYQDQMTFIDASQPLGAPINVHLAFYLSSDLCGSGVAVGSPGTLACSPQPPANFAAVQAAWVHPYALTQLASTVQLPGGADTAVRLKEQPRGGVVPGPAALAGNTLDHQFVVANGATLDWTLRLDALIVLDGRDWLDPGNPDRTLYGTVKAWENLDYLNTLHLGGLQGTDALGNALPGFEMRTSFGWALAPQPAAPVPEPGSAALLAAGLWALLRRRARHAHGAVALVAAAAPALVLAQTPSLQIQGRADSSMAQGAGTPAEFSTFRQGGGPLVDGVLSLGSLTDPAVDMRFWSRSSAQATAFAQLGHVGAQAGGEVVLGALGGGGQYARAYAQASFTDWLTLTPSDPALLFTSATLRYRVDWSGNGGVTDNSTTARVLARWCGRAGGGDFQCGGWFSDSGETGLGRQSGPLPGPVEYEQRFTWGLPVPIGVSLVAEFEIVGLNNGSASGYYDLSQSAAWGGILGVALADGTPVAPLAYALSSASGTNYSGPIAAVPAPPALWLWLAGVPLLAWRRRGATR